MPSSSASRNRRRKAKQANKKKITTLTLNTTPNHHSSPTLQLQGDSCQLKSLEEEDSKIKGHSLSSASHSKMRESFISALQEKKKVESLSEDKEVVVQVAADGNSSSLNETQDGYIVITDELATHSEEKRELVGSGKVEDTQYISESIFDSLETIVSSPNDFSDATQAAQVDNTLASDTSQLKKHFLSTEPEEADKLSPVKGLEETELPLLEDNSNELSSISGNEGLRETENVKTIKDMTWVDEEENNVLSSVVTDRLLSESEEPNEDVASKGTEKSWMQSTDEKVGDLSDVQESSYQSVEESFQPLPNVPDTECNSDIVQEENEVLGRSGNPTIVSVTQRKQYTSWRSCCGLFDILKSDDR